MKFEVSLSIHTIEEAGTREDAIATGKRMADFIQSIVNKDFWTVQFIEVKQLPILEN